MKKLALHRFRRTCWWYLIHHGKCFHDIWVVSEAGASEAHEEGADHLLPLPERPAGAPALHGARAAPAPATPPQRYALVECGACKLHVHSSFFLCSLLTLLQSSCYYALAACGVKMSWTGWRCWGARACQLSSHGPARGTYCCSTSLLYATQATCALWEQDRWAYTQICWRHFDCWRNYKNGYVWNDLSENDVIYPSDGVEYVLKGSEIFPGCSSGTHRPSSPYFHLVRVSCVDLAENVHGLQSCMHMKADRSISMKNGNSHADFWIIVHGRFILIMWSIFLWAVFSSWILGI